MTSASKDRGPAQDEARDDLQPSASGLPQRVVSGPIRISEGSRQSQKDALLYELDTPEFGRPQSAVSGITSAVRTDARRPLHASAEQDATLPLPQTHAPDPRAPSEVGVDVEAKTPAFDASACERFEATDAPDPAPAALAHDVLVISPAPTRSYSTRASTHVPHNQWFDVVLSDLNAGPAADPRRRLAWRFKACVAAYRMIGPLASAARRQEVASGLRDYERALRAATAEEAATKQGTDTLHAQLGQRTLSALEALIARVEERLLAIDASIDDHTFGSRFNKHHVQPKTLLRYTRLLGSRRFDIGYRRDRFEALAQQLLTAQTRAGELLLMPRAKAATVLRQLLRGLPRPPLSREEQSSAVNYLRDALDRLGNISGPKQFFDSGYYLDVQGYKVSTRDRVTDPEFLYLCVAIDVEVHNRLRAFSRGLTPDHKAMHTPSWETLLAQLGEQQTAVRSVFTDFRSAGPAAPRPAYKAHSTSHKPRAARAKRTRSQTTGPRLYVVLAAALLALAAIGANLFALGVVEVEPPPQPMAEQALAAVSPLLLRASLSTDGKHLTGLLSRPAWRRLTPRERQTAADTIADTLHRRSIDFAKLLAYKSRAIEIRYGSVVYVDDGK